MKAQVADAFIAKFQLTPDEMNLLRGMKDEPITEVSQWILKALPWNKMWKHPSWIVHEILLSVCSLISYGGTYLLTEWWISDELEMCDERFKEQERKSLNSHLYDELKRQISYHTVLHFQKTFMKSEFSMKIF